MPRRLGPLFLLLFAACSDEQSVWLPPPNSALPTAFIAVGSNVTAYDLAAAQPLELPELAPGALVEAAVFADTLDALGIPPGPVDLDTTTTSYQLGDGSEFFQYEVGSALEDWIEATELSDAHARFRIPAAKPVDPCPTFDIEEVIIRDNAVQHLGGPGPNDTIVLGGDNVYLMDGSGAFQEISIDPVLSLFNMHADDGRGLWLGDGRAWRGVVDDGRGRLDLTQIPSPTTSARLVGIAGDPLSEDEIYAYAFTSTTVDVLHYDGTRWIKRAEVLSIDGSQNLEFIDGEAVFVDNTILGSIHVRGADVRRVPSPVALSVVANVPGLGVLAGNRGEIHILARDGWEPFATPPNTTRYRGIVPYADGFFVIWDSEVSFWLPDAGGFCEPIEIMWSDLKYGHAFRDGTAAVWARGDADSRSIRAYILRRR